MSSFFSKLIAAAEIMWPNFILFYRNQNFDHRYQILTNLSLLNRSNYFGAYITLRQDTCPNMSSLFSKLIAAAEIMWPNFILPKTPVHGMKS